MDAIAVPTGNAGFSDWAQGSASSTEALGRPRSDSIDPAIRFGEIGFNEWEVALWPMKIVMVGGAILLILQAC